MNSDAYFTIGSTHKICEDYAVAGQLGHRVYAIIADGCSSSLDTDIGARFLVKALQQTLSTGNDVESYKASIIAALHVAYSSAKVLEMPARSLDATLGLLVVDEGRLMVFLTGDGIVARRLKDGSILHTVVDFEGNAPYYLSYGLDSNRYEQYRIEYGGRRKMHLPDPDGSIWPKIDVDIEEQIAYIPIIDPEEVDSVAIFSDGIQTFSGPDKPSLQQIIAECMSFKNTKGEFVQRRCKRALKEYAAKGLVHQDDFSMAAINMEEP